MDSLETLQPSVFFDFDLPVVAWVLFGVALFLFIPLILVYLRPLWKVANAVKRSAPSTDYTTPAGVPVSVIVFAGDDAESLRRLLPSLLGQDYGSPFEVIVVNEGQSDATVEVVERLRSIHNNLYLTYTPDGARQLSRKKLGLMIGIKAARYPVVVHTTASARIDSDRWLAQIAAPFADPSIEVVIGYSHLIASDDTGMGRRYRAFNSVADSVPWLWAALAGKPYRGTELNLAYTRDIFFRNRGFSRSLNIKHGDDDIFVHEIVRPGNTAVVLSPDSMVERHAWNVPRVYRELRSRYFFTGRELPRRWRLMMTAGTLLLWAIVALAVVGACLAVPNLCGVAVGAFLILATACVVTVFWRKVIFALDGKKMLFTLAFLALYRPVANLTAWIRSLLNRKYNYTWN